MAINKNHEFDELDGIKCAIVEKNVSEDRVTFLKDLLTDNGFTVKVVPSLPRKRQLPPPKIQLKILHQQLLQWALPMLFLMQPMPFLDGC